MKQYWSVFLLIIFAGTVTANDSVYVRHITDTLSSKTFLGRGYVNHGMQKAAGFIEGEMKRIGLSTSRQSFQYVANSFPGKMSLSINGKMLRPGYDYIVGADSKSCEAKGALQRLDSVTYIDNSKTVIIKLVNKLTWTVARKQDEHTTFYVSSGCIDSPANFECKVSAKLLNDFKAENIIGCLKGAVKPDSFIVFTAHYDHLGAMGKDIYFPGANDNAGGVAFMLAMAKYYEQHPAPYSMLFIAFAGEEAGLVGSEYFVQHPTLALSHIKFLINLDLVGNGEDGITVVNATEFSNAFSLLQQINTEQHLLTAVNGRGKARNSDHYWFTEKGVPAFFIYTLGKRKAYHDVDDIAATVPWPEINDLKQLLIQFVERL